MDLGAWCGIELLVTLLPHDRMQPATPTFKLVRIHTLYMYIVLTLICP